MKLFLRSVVFGSAAILLIGSTLSQQSLAHGKKHNPVRYKYVMKHGIPEAYLGKSNPLKASADNLTSGAEIYAENCTSCHGPTGNGDGEAAKDLDPRPPALRGMMDMIARMKGKHGMRMGKSGMMGGKSGMMGGKHGMMSNEDREMSMMTEGYVVWTISEGGEALETAMPAFKDVLSEKEIWQVILFMMNGFDAKPKS